MILHDISKASCTLRFKFFHSADFRYSKIYFLSQNIISNLISLLMGVKKS